MTRPAITAGGGGASLLLATALLAPALRADVPETSILQPSAAVPADRFGSCVDVDQDVFVVGSVLAQGGRGSVVVFRESAGAWLEEEELGDGVPSGAGFGAAVGVNGNHVFVGAPQDSTRKSLAGAVYSLLWNGSSWAQNAVWAPNNLKTGFEFGASVATYDRWAVVGAPGLDSGNREDRGGVYVYRLNNKGVWKQRQRLVPSDSLAGDRYGTTVAVGESQLLIGAPNKEFGRGAVAVYRRQGNRWIEHQTLRPAAPTGAEQFGHSMAIGFDELFIGVPGNRVDRGAVQTFDFYGGAWRADQFLVPSDRNIGERFGEALAVDGGRLVISAPMDGQQGVEAGSAYLFYLTGGRWRQNRKWIASDAQVRDGLGKGVCIDRTAFVAAPRRGDQDQGGAYTFSTEPLHMIIVPDQPVVGQTVQINVSAGRKGGPMFIAAIAVNDRPFYLPLIYAPFDQYGTFTLPLAIPPGLEGVKITFLGFGESMDGTDGLSNYDSFTVQ